MANQYEYIVFESDQVLTNDHLNETFNYLDQQNRWTRNKLIGIGIVCGLNIVQHTGTIEITKGCGVTSQGYLILLDTAQYAYYIPYTAPDQPTDLPFTYPGALPFYKPFSQNKNIFLLLTDDEYNALESDQQKNALTLSSAPANFLNDYVVVLFLEARELDLKNCDMFDCNNKGEKMLFDVKPLIVSKKDLPDAITEGRGTVGENLSNIPHEINFKRYNVPYVNLQTSDDVINGFVKLVDDLTLSRVANAYIYSYEKYKLLLNQQVNPFTTLFTQLKTQRDAILKNNKVFIQYFYDFVDDLIKAYYEFTVKITGIVSACCPDENLFPLHLVLGEASKNTEAYAKDAYRQYFIYSPLFEKTDSDVTEAVFLFQRMMIMVKEFTVPSPATFSNTTIKITPSQYEHLQLSQRAIPYYYRVNEIGSELYKAWSYYKTTHGNAGFNMSYNANLYNSNDAVVHPLLYDIEYYNFFRVEGHIGKNYSDVLSNLASQIQNFNLPFDIVAVQAGGDVNDVSTNLPQCSFQDLDSLFNVLRSELYCLLGELMCYAARQVYAPPIIITHIPTGVFDNLETLKAATEIKTEARATGIAETKAASTVASEALAGSIFKTPLFDISLISKFFIYQKSTFLKKQSCFNTLVDNSVGKFYAAHPPAGSYFFSSFDPANLSNNFLTLVDLIEEVVSTIYFATPSTLNVDTFSQKINSLKSYLQQLINVFLQFEINQKKENLFTDFEENMDLFDAVIDSCFVDEFTSLKNEYTARATRVKQQMLFSNYFNQHKGMEHKAGVPKGGTFIIVYNPPVHRQPGTTEPLTGVTGTFTTATASAVALNEASKVSGATSAATAETVTNKAAKTTTGKITEAPSATNLAHAQFSTSELTQRLQSSFGDVIARDPDFINRAISILSPAISAIALPPTFADNEVIADFYIPYKCCSDCPPVAYILPEKEPPPEKPTIQMQTSFCDDDKTAYPITVSPAGGTFADANGNKIKGLDETKLTFMPTAAGAGTYTIIYTVNGVASDPVTVTVLKKPSSSDFKFEATKKTDLTFETRFFPAIQDDTFSYKWTFGAGFSPQQSTDELPVITATIPATGGEIRTSASLIVSNGICAATEIKKELLISPNGVSQINTSVTRRDTTRNIATDKATQPKGRRKKQGPK